MRACRALAILAGLLAPGLAQAADVDITVALAVNGQARVQRGMVWTTAAIGYAFFIDSDNDFVYSKTTDSGATWAASVAIHEGASVTVNSADCWFDQWTPGHTGTKIHCVYIDEETGDNVFYRALDTSDDSLSTETTVFDGASSVGAVGTFVTIAKARPACNSGNHLLVAFDMDAGAETGTYRSTDNGATWGVRTDLVEATTDRGLMFPANDADPCDMWMLYLDASANGLSLKIHDDSANTNSELAIIADGSFVEDTTDVITQNPYSCAVRPSDGKLICALWTERDSATGDFRVFSINTSAATELTAIISNKAESYNPAVMVDPCDRIWVGYNGSVITAEVMGTTTKIYYALSLDGGTTWTKDAVYSEAAAADNFQVWAPLNGPRFALMWRIDSTDDLETNALRSVPTPSSACASTTGSKGVIGG